MPEFQSNLNIICIESNAFRALVSEVTTQMKEEFYGSMNPWIDEKEAMALFRITAKATFKKYCEEGNIVTSTLSNKKILYHRQSILNFIESRKNE